MATLNEFSRELSQLVEARASNVVRVEARRGRPATGMLWSSDGLVVTASHAVDRDEELGVSIDGESTVPAELLGRDPTTDVAVLKLAAGGRDLAPNEAAPLKVGHLLVALARPGRTVRAGLGIVSALAEGWRNPAGSRLDRYVEADMGFGPGFSGGPVFDAAGAFVGMGTRGLVPRATMIVPAQQLRAIVELIQSRGGIRRGYLGIGSHPVRLQGTSREVAGADVGLLVFSVEPGGPSDQGGLLIGDVLLSLDGQPTRHIEDLLGLLTDDQVGRAVQARLLRAGAIKELELRIGERP